MADCTVLVSLRVLLLHRRLTVCRCVLPQIAQSVCELAASRRDCLNRYVQPKSAVLQFNRHTNKFGNLLSVTDLDAVELRYVRCIP